MSIKAPFQIKYASVSRTAKIALAAVGFHVTEPNWNNLDWDYYNAINNGWTYDGVSASVSPALNDFTGAATTWKLAFSFGIGAGGGPSNFYTNADFPDDVFGVQWYNNDTSIGATINMYFAGLNPAKTYTIKTVQLDSNYTLSTTMTWGSTSFTNPQSSYDGTKYTPLELTFPTLTPSGGGIITGSLVTNASGNSVINGLIITEN